MLKFVKGSVFPTGAQRIRVGVSPHAWEAGHGNRVGRCSRRRLKKDHPEYCNNANRRQGLREHRCVLAERGVTYWEHIPKILNWQIHQDHDPCPLAEPYQLVRNVLAAYVAEGAATDRGGHALLVYDPRNPAFQPRTDGPFERLRKQLLDPRVLRRCSWQGILAVMADYDDLRWLVQRLGAKYGLQPAC